MIHHPSLVNIYDSKIGDGTRIAAFVEIGGAKIGVGCKIEAFVFIAQGTIIGDYVFIGPHTSIGNYKHPDALECWKEALAPVTIKRGARIGQNVTVAPGVTIGERAFIKQNANVIHDVSDNAIVQGNPAR